MIALAKASSGVDVAVTVNGRVSIDVFRLGSCERHDQVLQLEVEPFRLKN